MTLTKPGMMMVAAHRGDCYNHFENTMDAFRAAIAAGADMVETDVRMTKDGVLVLMHDAKVDRTTDGTGLVAEMTFEELRKLNAGGKTMPAQIPTLEELLQLLAESNVMLNLEVKEYMLNGNDDHCRACIDKCAAMVDQYGLTDRMVFNSFDAAVLEYVDEKWPGKYLLHGFYPYSDMFNVRRNPDEYLYCACIFDDRNGERYQDLVERGIEPWIGAGVTKIGHLQECFDLGARLVTTNFPADCLKKLKGMGARNA